MKNKIANAVKARAPIKEAYDIAYKELKELKAKLDEANDNILNALSDADLSLAQVDVDGTKISVSKQSKKVFNINNWEEFFDYVYKEKAGYLLKHSINQKAMEELTQFDVPFSISEFTKHTLSVRKVAK